MSSLVRTSLNCALSAVIFWAVYYILFTADSYASYLWTDGGIPGLLISAGLTHSGYFFLYDILRFSLFSFLAVWPVTLLRPQRPVLYSIVMMAFLVVWLSLWKHLFTWPSLPSRALWSPWLVLVWLLSVPGMYQLRLWLKSRHNKTSKADAVNGAA